MAFRAGRRGFRSLRVVRNLSIFMQNGFPPFVERAHPFIRPLSGRRIVRKRQCVRSVSASGADVSVKEAGSGSVRMHGCTDAECRRKEAACVRSWIELGVARI